MALEWPGDVRDLPASAAAPWLLALAVAGLVVVVVIGRRRRARPAAALAPAVAVPEPTVAALLRALPTPADAAAVAAFAAEVKRLVRMHARQRFGLAAFAATSEELQQALPQAPGLAPCLQACDTVLFAASALRTDAAASLRAHALAFAGGDASEERAP